MRWEPAIRTRDGRVVPRSALLDYPGRAFAEAAERAMTEDAVRQLPRRAGSVNQWADATEVLERPPLLPRLRVAYEPG